MTVKFAVVDESTGEILRIGLAPMLWVSSQAKDSERAMTVPRPVSDEGWFLDLAADEFVERPEMPAALDKPMIAADGVDRAEIVGLPEGTEVVVRRVRHVIKADGIFYFRARVPGTYVVRARFFPYRDVEWRIEVR